MTVKIQKCFLISCSQSLVLSTTIEYFNTNSKLVALVQGRDFFSKKAKPTN